MAEREHSHRCHSRSQRDRYDPGFYPWDGSYEKQFYDVKLRDGRIVEHCWPNAGFMCTTNGSGVIFEPAEIVGIRVAQRQGR